MRFSLFLFFIALISPLNAQKLFPPTPVQGESLPEWAKWMYGRNPNVWKIDDAYHLWRQTHPDEKTTYTQYYKKWRRAAISNIDNQGFIQKNTPRVRLGAMQERAPVWGYVGPLETFNTNQGPNPLAKSEQANVYCFDQSLSNPDVLYCGTEGGEVFKSTDRGNNWFCVSRNLPISAPTALEVHPSNSEIVLLGEGSNIRMSLDGGANWQVVLNVPDFSPNEIVFNPQNPNIVLAATWRGLYRSMDAGFNWTLVFPEACYDIDWKSDDPQTAFLLRNNPSERICTFYKSSDFGETWSIRQNGWYSSTDSARTDGGARLAVSKADPNRVYVILIGESKAGDDGFIGLYRSDDAGESWTLPNPPAGGPYDDTQHPNMATIGTTGGYHQGFYNLGLDVSDSNPDQVLVGFLKLWRSQNGAASFECIGGYCSNPFNYVHPDCQEIEINGDDIWMTSDGGIEHSTDFFQTHYAQNRGITSSDFWGFGAGWNEDILVGGRYHNGNTAWYETWEEGEFLGLGGGEASTGYVNPGIPRTAYFSDLGLITLPEVQNGYTQYAGFGKFPNESYYEAESGEMEFDPRCWNHLLVSRDNILWRTEDGLSWNPLHTFGNDPNSRILQFEICRSNPDVLYAFQRAAYSWDPGQLWKSNDGGKNWFELSIPPAYARRMLLSVDPENENRIWVAFPDGSNDAKMFFSADGGQSWKNITTNALSDQTITYILCQGGTQGGIYVATYRSIYYRNEAMNDWQEYADGLPAQIATCILRPFYRDGRLRLGAYGKGIWEAPWFEMGRPVAQPMVNKRITECPGEVFEFDDYSMLLHEGAKWLWHFPGGTPEFSSLRNPKVTYQQPGVYDVQLTVTDQFGNSSTKTVPQMLTVLPVVINSLPVACDFSNGPDPLTVINPDGDITWAPISLTSCDTSGNTAYYVHNYVYSGYGRDELLFPVNLDLTQLSEAKLKFNVAYAPYFDGNAFIDSLFVTLSDDCGASTKSLFRSGGEALSTTTSGIGQNNLYEYEEFSPQSCEEWREIQLDLADYLGKIITLHIISQSGYGNNLYIDAISLNGELMVSTNQAKSQDAYLRIAPNPTSGALLVRGKLPYSGLYQLLVEDAVGQTVVKRDFYAQAGGWDQELSLQNMPAGVYFVRLAGADNQVVRVVKQ